MRRAYVLGSVLLTLVLSSVSHAQEPERYPGLSMGDTTPGTPSLPRDLELTVAAGVGYQPDYMGSDDYEAIFTPAIDLEYKDRAFLVIDRQAMMVPYEGLGIKLLANQDVSLGVNVNYDHGRDDDSDFIRGIGEVDWTATGGAFAVYHPGPFFARAQIDQDMLDEYNGYKGEIGAGITGPLTPRVRGFVEARGKFSGENYQESYFGVNNAQSAATGGRVGAYDPDGGFYQVEATGIVQYNVTPGAFVQGIGKISSLTGDAADSTISQDGTAIFVGANAGYKF